MMTVPVFLLMKKVDVRSEKIKSLLANLTTCGFGIYMVHYFFTGSDAGLPCSGGFTDTCRRGCRICHFLVDRSFHLSIDGEECQVCSRVTLYCNKVKLFKSMCLCVRKDVWVIFEQHLLRWSSNAWGELKVKSEEKMLDFLVDTPLLSVLALA